MRKFNVYMTYRVRRGKGTGFQDWEEVVETDDIMKWVKDNRVLSGFTYWFGKQNSWLRYAEEVTDEDEYQRLGVENKDLFGGDFVLRKISKSAVAEAKAKYDAAQKAWGDALTGEIVK